MNLFDLMRQAGGGNAFAALAPQFGLTEEQVASAMEALAPAFSAGLKRSTSDPAQFFDFMKRLASGDFLSAYRNPGSIFGGGAPGGQDALGVLFGSPDIVRNIAELAAAFSGIAPDKLKEMMPALASLMLGGLASQAASAYPWFDSMMQRFRSPESTKSTAKGPLDRYEDEQAQRQAADPGNMAKAQADMLKAGLAAFEAGTAAWQKALAQTMPSAKTPEAKTSGESFFGDMLEPGRQLGEAYLREIEALVSQAPTTSRS